MNCYLILIHKNSLILKELINKLQAPVYIHPCLTLREGLDCNKANNVFVTKKRFFGYWGGFGIVSATIEGMRQIISEQADCSHITLLSGADYPIKPLHEFEKFLLGNKDSSFIRYWNFYPFQGMTNDTENPWHIGSHVQELRLKRYYYDMFNERYSIPLLENEAYFQFGALQKLKHYFKYGRKYFTDSYKEEFVQLLYSYFLKFPRPIPLKSIYGGSQWWTICRKHAEYIIDFHDNNRKITNFFKKTMLPDETFFQTILLTSPFKNEIVNDNYRLISFDGNCKHPKILTTEDFEVISKSNAYFARKFDDSTSYKIIQLIKKELL